jgi:spermidine/putrescine transport system substrate-binding protein
MKKLVLFLTMISLVLGLVGCGRRPTGTISIYAPADFISASAISSFQRQNRTTVTLNTYNSPDEIYQRLSDFPNTYDLIIAPDYIVDRMRLEDTLLPMDFSLIPNFSLIDDAFKVPDDRFSVPYMVTTLGILYNTEKIVEEDDVETWDVLWNQRYADSIIMTANIRDGIAIGLLSLGHSINSTSFSEIDSARTALQRQRRFVRWYQSVDAKANMVANRAAVAVVHSHEAQRAISENPELAFIIPKEGSARVVHSFAIPQGARNSDTSMKFINHMSDTAVAVPNTLVVQARSANRNVRAQLPPELRNSEVMFPTPEQLARCRSFNYDVAAMRMYQQAWLQVRAAR